MILSEKPVYYKSIVVNGQANAETVEEIITSTAEEKKKILGIFVTEVTESANNDAKIKIYLERELLGEFDIRHFLLSFYNEERIGSPPYLTLNHEIPVGQSLSIGHVSGYVASDISYTAVYEII